MDTLGFKVISVQPEAVINNDNKELKEVENQAFRFFIIKAIINMYVLPITYMALSYAAIYALSYLIFLVMNILPLYESLTCIIAALSVFFLLSNSYFIDKSRLISIFGSSMYMELLKYKNENDNFVNNFKKLTEKWSTKASKWRDQSFDLERDVIRLVVCIVCAVVSRSIPI